MKKILTLLFALGLSTQAFGFDQATPAQTQLPRPTITPVIIDATSLIKRPPTLKEKLNILVKTIGHFIAANPVASSVVGLCLVAPIAIMVTQIIGGNLLFTIDALAKGTLKDFFTCSTEKNFNNHDFTGFSFSYIISMGFSWFVPGFPWISVFKNQTNNPKASIRFSLIYTLIPEFILLCVLSAIALIVGVLLGIFIDTKIADDAYKNNPDFKNMNIGLILLGLFKKRQSTKTNISQQIADSNTVKGSTAK